MKSTRFVSLPLTLLAACVAARAGTSVPQMSATGPECSEVVTWRMPESTVVEATASDSRSIEVRGTQARINLLVFAAARFCLDSSRFPLSLAELVAARPARGRERCRVDPHTLVDWWGREFWMEVRESKLYIGSLGPDGAAGSPDDILIPSRSDPLAQVVDVNQWCSPGSGLPESGVHPL
jgi:hypothetical protein